MITGEVNANLEAILSLPLQDSTGRIVKIDASRLPSRRGSRPKLPFLSHQLLHDRPQFAQGLAIGRLHISRSRAATLSPEPARRIPNLSRQSPATSLLPTSASSRSSGFW